MDMPLIIKQVCQQPGLMEVMQIGSGPEKKPLGLRLEGGFGPQGGVVLDPRALAQALDIQ